LGITLPALRFYEAKRLIALAAERHTPVIPERPPAPLVRPHRPQARLYTRRNQQAIATPDGKNLHLSRTQCAAQINLLKQQKRDLEIAIWTNGDAE
jgi:hypothetical protein